MSAYDFKIGEIERDFFQIRNGASGFGGLQGPGMSDLGAERNIEFAAFGVQRVVASIIGRQVPQPRHDPKAFEAEVFHASAQFADGVHGFEQVRGGETCKSPGMGFDQSLHLIVADKPSGRAAPSRKQPQTHVRSVHGGDGRFRGDGLKSLCAVPTAKGFEHLMGGKALRRVLHPYVYRGSRHRYLFSPEIAPSN